ncbi:MAG: rhodanese-like domain-containing protein [Methylococcales bacterium]|nr:rhodanese-like domain-containing protein [Methylococcales bacterium]
MRVFSKYCRLGFMFFLMACAVAKADMGEIESVSPKHASAMYTGKKAVIVDVREDSEWNKQHIPGAIHIPFAQLSERLPELKQYKDSTVITQCKTGGRSARALDVLKSAGFSKVYNMDGGIVAWDKAGLKTE